MRPGPAYWTLYEQSLSFLKEGRESKLRESPSIGRWRTKNVTIFSHVAIFTRFRVIRKRYNEGLLVV